MQAPSVVTTPHIHLRRLQQSDAPQLCAAYQRSSDDLECDVTRTDTIEAARAAIASYDDDFESARAGGPGRYVYGLFSVETGELSGCGSIDPSDRRAFNVGVWLDAAARGRGHATAAVTALTAIAFRWLDADRTELWCDRDNRAMTRIAERLGYTREATLRRWFLCRSGERRDSLIWRLEAAEYAASPSATVAATMEEGPEPPRDAASQAEWTWARVASHLRAHHVVVDEGARGCELAVEVVFRSGRHCTQSVIVEQGRVSGTPWLMLRAVVGPEALLDGRDALQHNTTLAAGALAIEHGQHVLRHGVAPDAITTRGIDRVIAMMAHEAARLRDLGAVEPDSYAQAFANYSD